MPLRIMTHVEFGLLDCAFQGSLSMQIFDDAPVSVRAKRARVAGHFLVEQGAHLLNQSIGKVFVCSPVNAFIEFCARRIKRKDTELRFEVRRRRQQEQIAPTL